MSSLRVRRAVAALLALALTMAGVTFVPLFVHLFQASTAATNAANWFAGRFSGTPATSNCGSF